MKTVIVLLCLCTALACGMPKYTIQLQPHTVIIKADGRPAFIPAGVAYAWVNKPDTVNLITVIKRKHCPK